MAVSSKFLHAIGEDVQIENLEKPFIAIASDLMTGREVWLQNGSLLDSVRASTAIPGVFGAKNLGGKWLLDGGMTNPVPVSACRAMGADIIIAVDPNANLLQTYMPTTSDLEPEASAKTGDENPIFGSQNLENALTSFSEKVRQGVKAITPDILGIDSDSPGYIEVVSKSIDIMTDQIKRNRLASDPPHVLLSQELQDISSLDFHRAEEAINKGRESVVPILPLLHRYIGLA